MMVDADGAREHYSRVASGQGPPPRGGTPSGGAPSGAARSLALAKRGAREPPSKRGARRPKEWSSKWIPTLGASGQLEESGRHQQPPPMQKESSALLPPHDALVC